MEGIGSRLGRVSSRYGASPGPPAPVFSGPVRKWKRRWVRSQPTNNATSGKAKHHHQEAHSLLLCRWTPLTSTDSDDSAKPKRRFRYTPVIVLEEKKKEAIKKVGDEAKTNRVNQSTESVTVRSDMHFEKPFASDLFMEEIKELSGDEAWLNKDHLDLQLCLEKPPE